jgi:hypothetical protein
MGVSRIVQSVSDLSSDSGEIEFDKGCAPGDEDKDNNKKKKKKKKKDK